MKATKGCCLLLLHSNHHSPSTLLLILPPHNQQKWKKWNWLPPPKLTITTDAVPLYICRAQKWDSNAESFRTQNFDYGYDDDFDEESADTLEQWDEVLEDFIDSIWIFKVLGSYGWGLPFILISLLLATGPKAFLMALALPLGQSTFSFAIQRMQGKRQNKPKVEPKTKKRSRARSSKFVRREKDNSTRNPQVNNRKAKMGYQSWVPQDEGSIDTSDKDVANFGGWDELDKGSQFDLGSRRSSAQTTGRSKQRPLEQGSLSSRMAARDTPLLLRLLIAAFPFLSSWTKML